MLAGHTRSARAGGRALFATVFAESMAVLSSGVPRSPVTRLRVLQFARASAGPALVCRNVALRPGSSAAMRAMRKLFVSATKIWPSTVTMPLGKQSATGVVRDAATG